MAQVTRRYREVLSELRRQASFRGGDEKTILLGWGGTMEHHINRLEKGELSEPDIILARGALKHCVMESWDVLDDIMSSKAPPHCSQAERDAAVKRYAEMVANQPWALPTLVKPKGQWGGKR